MQSSASCTSLALKLTAGTHVSAGGPNAASRIEGGTPTFRRGTQALNAAGVSTFTGLYCVQPFLPVLKDTFHVSPAESGLALPLCTGLLAVSLLIAGPFSENWGPRAAGPCRNPDRQGLIGAPSGAHVSFVKDRPHVAARFYNKPYANLFPGILTDTGQPASSQLGAAPQHFPSR